MSPLRAIGAVVVLLVAFATPVSAAPPGLGSALAGQVVPGEIIVGITATGDIDTVARGVGASQVTPLLGGNAYVLQVPGDPFGIAAQARTIRGVDYAEPNYIRTLHAEPSDAGFDLKWDLHNDGTHGTRNADIDWLEAYDYINGLLTEGLVLGNVVVAVLDTGIDADHPDLNDKLVVPSEWRNTVDTNGDPSDGFGHGTHVSGIAAGETNNGQEDTLADTASVGYADAIKIMPVKVCDDGGSCPTSAIVDGIYWAAASGANVINLSLGGSSISQAEINAINFADGAGVLIVASAGNGNTTTESYPAAHGPVMAVAATNSDDDKADYSNYGADWVDITAPGGEMSTYDDPGGIYSTMPTYEVYLTGCDTRGNPFTRRPCYDTHYDQLQGTSMSAPQVAGAAALLFALNPSLTNDEVRSILETTADPISGTDNLWANGRLNVHQAVLAATDGDTPPTVSVTNPADGSTVSSTVLVTAYASDDDSVSQVEFFVDSTSIGIDTNGGDGWSASWDTTTNADGSHAVSATATDTDGQTSSDSVNVTVDNVDDPPTVSVTNPADGSTVSSTVLVTAYASDDDSVSQVEFFVDSTSIGIDTNGGDGWSASWDTTANADGSHAVSATATDTDGQTSSDSVNVTVDNSVTTKLTVSLIDPDKVVAGDSVDVTITGTGFADGATVTLENGSGPTPTVSNVVFGDANRITATISTRSNGPPRNRAWDVRVTNPDGTSDVRVGGFTVTVG
jgi:thermitase